MKDGLQIGGAPEKRGGRRKTRGQPEGCGVWGRRCGGVVADERVQQWMRGFK
ncbi:hypothetical protein Hanom_Chr08g00694241 [Helianthus anomalus]